MKNKLFRRIITGLLLSSLVLSTAGCGDKKDDATKVSAGGATSSSSQEAVPAQADDDTLNIAVSIDFNTVDTLVAYGTEIDILVNSVTEGLFYYDENSEVQPFLVSSYTHPDDTTYVYEIREDVVFSDGTPLDADDVEFSLNRHLDPDNASQLGWMFENVESIEKTGDYEVTVKLSQPDASWQYTLATPAGNVISKDYYEAHKDGYGTSEGGFIGSGPYVITSWDTAEIDLEYNEDYWNKAETEVDFKKLKFLSIPDQSVVKAALESGQIDITQALSLDAAKELKSKDIVNIQATDYLGSTFISFNTTVDKLSDKKVRQAIAYAVDKETILNDIIGADYASIGKSQLFSSNISNAYPDIWGDYFDKENAYSYDPEKAKELLAEAGYPDGFDVQLKYVASDSTSEDVSLYIQQNLAEVGINVTLEGIDSSEYSTLRYGGSETREYELFLTYWGSDYPDPIGTITPMYYSTNNVAGGSNWAEYKNKDFDKLIDEQNSASTPEERIPVLKDALDILAEDIPYAPVYNHYKVFATSKRVDYQFSTMLLYNIYTKNIKKAK